MAAVSSSGDFSAAMVPSCLGRSAVTSMRRFSTLSPLDLMISRCFVPLISPTKVVVFSSFFTSFLTEELLDELAVVVFFVWDCEQPVNTKMASPRVTKNFFIFITLLSHTDTSITYRVFLV